MLTLKSLGGAHQAAFARALQAARKAVNRRIRLLRLARVAYAKLLENEGSLGRTRTDVWHLIRMVRAWARREYGAVPWRALVYVVGALIYFVNPADLIPDAIVGIGFLDDAAIIAAVVRALRSDVDAFLDWEAAHQEAARLPESGPPTAVGASLLHDQETQTRV